MKNFSKSIFSLLIAGMVTTAIAADNFNGITNLTKQKLTNATINGFATLTDVTAESLTAKGPLHFKNLTVSGNANVIGNITGENGHFEKLELIGTLHVKNVTIKILNVKGPVL